MRSGPTDFELARGQNRHEGLPEVPPEWAPFLLQKPMKGVITDVIADQMAIMNVGGRDGSSPATTKPRRENGLGPREIKVLFTVFDHGVVRLSPPEVEGSSCLVIPPGCHG